ncbi:MAG: hypothetical protein A2X49_03155 [Lentisphaerae bacterium GWF2_52_8]|nr:MAG: hypothetical protein A2X49_03155 [Lentisphaerae bacterium GWF2_52_8]
MRIGVVGFGARAAGVINHVFREASTEFKIVALVDPDKEKAKSRLLESDKDASFYDSLDKMLKSAKLDALFIGTRCNLHSPYAIEAAKYDIPLFLEKPVSVTMEQAMALEKAYQKSRCKVLVSFPLRVSPICVRAREMIAGAAIGEPNHVHAVNYVPYGVGYFEGAYRNYEVTQGLFLQKATHDLDYIMFLMGSRIKRIAAIWSLGKVFGGKKPSKLHCSVCGEQKTCLESPENRKRNFSGGTETDHPCPFSKAAGNPKDGMNEDSSSSIFEFESGAHGVYSQVFYTRREGERGAKVSGYKGSVSFDWYSSELKLIEHHAPFTNVLRPPSGMSHFGGDIELARNFLAMIKDNAKPMANIWDGIQSAYTCLAAKESASTGKFVKVRMANKH